MESKSAIAIIEAAYAKEKIEIEFDIPLPGGQSIPAKLAAPDIYEIQELADLNYNKKFDQLREEGLHERPIDEKQWEKDIEEARKELKREGRGADYIADAIEKLRKDKPLSMAHQMATKFSQIRTSMDVIPLYLRNKDDTPLFPTPESRKAFKRILASDVQLMNFIAHKYLDLTLQITNIGDTAKNSPRQDGSRNGSSSMQLLDDTVKAPSTKKSGKA
jgi:hypothetical protein